MINYKRHNLTVIIITQLLSQQRPLFKKNKKGNAIRTDSNSISFKNQTRDTSVPVSKIK